jgi:hypothetical protein
MLALLGVSSVDSSYIGKVILIWIFTVSSVSLVVVPKIYKAIKIRRHPELSSQGRRRPRVRITGLALQISDPPVVSALSSTLGHHQESTIVRDSAAHVSSLEVIEIDSSSFPSGSIGGVSSEHQAGRRDEDSLSNNSQDHLPIVVNENDATSSNSQDHSPIVENNDDTASHEHQQSFSDSTADEELLKAKSKDGAKD